MSGSSSLVIGAREMLKDWVQRGLLRRHSKVERQRDRGKYWETDRDRERECCTEGVRWSRLHALMPAALPFLSLMAMLKNLA